MNNSIGVSNATGVDLQLNIAGPGARSYAFVIDWHIRLLLALAWFLLASVVIAGSVTLLDSDDANYSLFVFLALLPSGAIYFLYHPVLEILMRGRTPGKRLAGIRIVTLDAQEPGVIAHLIRNLLRLLDSLPAAYVIGLVSTLVTQRAERIGDIAAGTVLIYDSDARDEKHDSVPVSPAAIQRFGLAKAELAQDLLNRWDDLEEEYRVDLGAKLLLRLDPAQQAAPDAPALHRQLQALIDSGEQS